VPKFLEIQSHIDLPVSCSQPSHIQAAQSHSANPAIYRHPNLIQPMQPYTGNPISFSQPSHIQATQSHSVNPAIYRQPNPIKPTQPYTGNPISFSQPSHIQATQSHSANPISFSQPSHIQATQSHSANPISFSQPSHIQATQSHSANPISFSQPSHTQATEPHIGNLIYHIYATRVTFCLYFKRIFVQNLSYENEFDLHENEAVGQIHFHMNGFTCKLVLMPKLKETQKWPISYRQFSHIQAPQPYIVEPRLSALVGTSVNSTDNRESR